MTHSQPASFQEYTPIGTPDKQYMMPAHSSQAQAMHTAAVQYNMPCSQPCSGIDSTDCTPVRPSSTQSFSQPRPFSSSPAQQQGQGMLSRLQNTSSHRAGMARQASPGQTLSSSQRQPGQTLPSSQGQMMPQQQQGVRPIRGPLPLHLTVSHPSSQTLTPQSNSPFQSAHASHLSQQSSKQQVQ